MQRVFVVFLSVLTTVCLSCSSSNEASLSDFAISSSTLEIATLIDKLDFPMGVAVDIDATKFKDNVFVADRIVGDVFAVNSNGKATALGAKGLSGPGSMLFDILPDAFFVVETESNEISRVDFSQTPTSTTVVAVLPQGIFPVAIATDGQFRYVAAHDTTKLNSDKIYNISTSSPSLMFEGEVANIAGLTFRFNDDKPEFLATDSKGGNLLLIKPNDNGDVVNDFEVLVKDLSTPTAMAIGPASGFIYLAETGADRVVRYTADGSENEVVAKIVACNSLAFNAQGDLFVGSSKEGKVFKLTGLGEALN